MSNQIEPNRRQPLIVEEERYIVTSNDDGLGSGVLIGIILAVVVGAIGAIFFFSSQRQVAPTRVVPEYLPNTSQSPSKQTTTTTTQRTETTTKQVVPDNQPKH